MVNQGLALAFGNHSTFGVYYNVVYYNMVKYSRVYLNIVKCNIISYERHVVPISRLSTSRLTVCRM